MRIPQGYNYFGERIAEPIPSRGTPGSIPRPDLGVSAGLQDLGGAVLGVGQQMMRKEDQEREKIENEVKQQLKETERQKEHADRQTKIIQYAGSLDELSRQVLDDKDVPDDQKISRFEELASKVKAKALEGFGEQGFLLDPVHARAVFDTKQRIYQAHEKRMADETRAGVAQSVEELYRLAEQGPAGRASAVALLESMEYPRFTEQEVQTIKQTFREKTAINEVAGRLNSGDYQATLEDLQKQTGQNFAYLPDLDPKDREHFIGSIKTHIDQEKRRLAAEQKAAQREWRTETREMIAEYKDRKLAGLPVDPQEELALAKRVRGTEFAKKFTDIRAKGESFAFKAEHFAKDPLTFGAAQMGIQIQPLSLEDPAILVQQVELRKKLAGAVQASSGLSYAPLLTTDETKALGQLLKKQGPAGVGTLQQLGRMLGRDGLAGIAVQMGNIGADEQTGMVIGYVAKGKPEVALAIVEGERYMKDKVIKMPKEDDLRAEWDKRTRDSLQGIPRTAGALYEAWKAHYISQAGRKGINDGSIDGDFADKAFKAIVGSTAKINGKRVLLPEGFNEGGMLNSIKAITPNLIGHMGGVFGMTAQEAADVIRHDAQWEATGHGGVFRPMIGGQYLRTADGKNWVQFRFDATLKPSEFVEEPEPDDSATRGLLD